MTATNALLYCHRYTVLHRLTCVGVTIPEQAAALLIGLYVLATSGTPLR